MFMKERNTIMVAVLGAYFDVNIDEIQIFIKFEGESINEMNKINYGVHGGIWYIKKKHV